MDKRRFLAAAAGGGLLPATRAGAASPQPAAAPALLTVVGGARGNRGPVDPWRDLLMVKHGIRFTQALALDAAALGRMPAVGIEPTLEYDARPHSLRGPLLTTVLAAAGVAAGEDVVLGLRAVDGYAARLALRDAQRMVVATQLDGSRLALGGLGPQWAVHDPAAIPQLKDRPLAERFVSCPWGLYCIEVLRG